MDNVDTAKERSEEAMRRLQESYTAAVQAFLQLEAAHQRGDFDPTWARAFRAAAQQVHADTATTRSAHVELRHLLKRNQPQRMQSGGRRG